jgi:hypothetical protein
MRVSPFLGVRRAAYAKLEASCTTVNQSKFMGYTKPGPFEILNFNRYFN